MKTSDQHLLEQLKAGEQEVLKVIYLQHRKEFIEWLTSQDCSSDIAVEIFQLTILIFYDNIVNGKLTTLKSSLRTYLFSIGKNKWKEWQRAESKRRQIFKDFVYDHIEINNSEYQENRERLLNQVVESLKNLGNPCQLLLEMYYYSGLSMKEICHKLGYKNTDTAKNQKYKCLKRLRKLIQTELEKKADNEVKPRGITSNSRLPKGKPK